jgi:hypothetical protein
MRTEHKSEGIGSITKTEQQATMNEEKTTAQWWKHRCKDEGRTNTSSDEGKIKDEWRMKEDGWMNDPSRQTKNHRRSQRRAASVKN